MAKKRIKGDDGKEYIVKEKKPFYKKWWFWLIIVFLIIGAIGQNAEDNDEKDVVKNTTEKTSEPDKTSTSSITSEEVEKENDNKESNSDNNVSSEFKSALRKAEAYSNKMSMSKSAIYDQLTSEYGEKFSPEAGQYAVDTLQTDYNRNALKKLSRIQIKCICLNKVFMNN